MSKHSNRLPKYLCAFAVLAGWLWLCLTLPDTMSRWAGIFATILFIGFAAILLLGLIVAFVACVFLPPTPPADPSSPAPAAPPAPVRQRDTLTPLLLGLALGWWLGSGPGDGKC